MRAIAYFLSVIAALAQVTPAAATVWHFELTSVNSSEPSQHSMFNIDSSTNPDYFVFGAGAVFDDVRGTFVYDGFSSSTLENITFYNANVGGGLITSDDIIYTYGGQIYSGNESEPKFMPGTYPLTDLLSDQPLLLTISSGAVPEPTTWSMMLLGIGAIGSFVRRKRYFHFKDSAP